MRTAFLLLPMLLLGACATVTQQPAGPCLALGPYFPERVHKADHPDTKAGALKRNAAFGGACPGMMKHRRGPGGGLNG